MAPELVEKVFRTHFDYVRTSDRVHAGNQLFGEHGYSIADIPPGKGSSLFYHYLELEFDLILYDVEDCNRSFVLPLGLPSFLYRFA